MGAAFSITLQFENSGECPTCGVPVIMPADTVRRCREDKRTFYCHNGHAQSFTETENMRLKRELETKQRELEMKQRAVDAANARAEMAGRSRDAYKGKVTEIKNRVCNGVCPCCNRSFTNLRRHMHTKHPDFKDGKS